MASKRGDSHDTPKLASNGECYYERRRNFLDFPIGTSKKVAAEQGVVRAAHRPVRFDGDHRSDFRPPPTLGEHTLQVLREAGLSPQAIARLQEQGVIG